MFLISFLTNIFFFKSILNFNNNLAINEDFLISFFYNKMFLDDNATLLLSRTVEHETSLVLNFFLTKFLIKNNC